MLAALSAAASVVVAGPAVVEPAVAAIERAIVRTEPVAYGALANALRARLPRVELLRYDATSFAAVQGQEFAYVEVLGETAPGAALTLTVVLSDGRAYVRSFVADEADPVRSVAAVTANTLHGIEQDDTPPTRLDAEIPVPAEAAPEPAPAPATAPVDPPPPAPRSEVVDDEPERARLGLSVHAGALVTLAPAVQAYAATGVDLAGAFTNGLLIGGGVRWAGVGADGFTLSRVRVAAQIGYVHRRRRFELVAMAGPSVEPWLVTERSGLEPTRRSDGARLRPPLLGGLASVSGGRVLATRTVDLVLAARVDLAASVLPSGRGAAVRHEDGRALFSFGGPELMAGLVLAGWY